MKQLLVISGKGGTGKTTLTSGFIKLSNCKAYGDCDVDAPNLHLLTNFQKEPNRWDFFGMDKAFIDNSECISCGLCMKNCRFSAITKKQTYKVDSIDCEGCGLCEALCPVGAIKLNKTKAGDLILYKEKEVFSTARLKIGSGNSGLLVTEVKKNLKNEISNSHLNSINNQSFTILDGPPGIGCPVIASINDVDMVLIVTEPSLSGISDMKRILRTCEKFNVKIAVCINKYDMNMKMSEEIEAFCNENNINFTGRIPYDSNVVSFTNKGISIVDTESPASENIKKVYKNMMEIFMQK
ncbi:MinD superfamily P-loop ATPase [Acetoanaerobium pronyense]|uniref:MinD superfamily P-loop ATPase n=1 Tax=Acetoanaerobium pronyense TaxID=1482736 RepID=A0ABS4KG91_9FIRM|nr:ATP-binding protein [Acetoanaerobium pronyense]MBP2026767.1 MinD superfamily P-loop ATPase [Acetoanaerobium pronyense]